MWKDSEAKKEALSKLEKINNRELTPRNQKSLTGFKKLKEYKFNKIRIIVNPVQKGAPEFVKQSMGHRTLDTTSAYVNKLSDQERQEFISQF